MRLACILYSNRNLIPKVGRIGPIVKVRFDRDAIRPGKSRKHVAKSDIGKIALYYRSEPLYFVGWLQR